MTQAYNLAILANAVDTSGKLNVGTNATGTLPVANGGTGTSTPSLVAGTGITITGSFPNQTIATSGGGAPQLQVVQYNSGSNTWTAPTGVTRAKVVTIGGGGGNNNYFGSGGGSGGFAVGWVTVTPGTNYTATVGAGGNSASTSGTAPSGGTSSFGSLISATGGGGGYGNNANAEGYTGNMGSGTISSGTNIGTGNQSQYGGNGLGPWQKGTPTAAGVVYIEYVG